LQTPPSNENIDVFYIKKGIKEEEYLEEEA